MSDGVPVPPAPDGMACFTADDGGLVVMRNHELPGGLRGRFYDLPIARAAYDPSAAGGVSRVVLDPATREVRSSNMVLAGTVMNCSGGPSPWGWLSCEETVDPDHGYVFLCDPSADHVAQPVRISGYGRFRHEAAAIDPARAVAYLTEDRPDGCLYRFVPHDPADPFEGRLQALRVRARPAENTAAWRRGQSAEIDWIDLPDPTPEGDALRAQAHALGAAVIKRGEGVTFDGDQITLCATTGGPIEAGQIFRLTDEGDGGTLEVLACSTDRAALDMPDNVTIAPSGSVFFVEDGTADDYVRGLTRDGELFDVARNAASDGELTGVCFSPDGGAMFVNLQQEGLTLIVEGPFARLV